MAALGTPEEQKTWARLKRIEDYLALHPDDPDLTEMREKLRLMKGVMYWRLSESFKARLWNERRSVKELEASLIETQKRARSGQAGARRSAERYRSLCGARGGGPRRAWISCKQRLAALTEKQNRYLQSIAIEELGRQKQRIETYQMQARFELAAIYDKATNEKPKAHP